MQILKTIVVFFIAGLCEIGGGYLVWLWLRENKSIWYGVLGGAILVLYGVVATLQEANFAKVYATYGGVFIVMSLVWAYQFDHYVPTKYDVLGALIALVGVAIIFYSPRT